MPPTPSALLSQGPQTGITFSPLWSSGYRDCRSKGAEDWNRIHACGNIRSSNHRDDDYVGRGDDGGGGGGGGDCDHGDGDGGDSGDGDGGGDGGGGGVVVTVTVEVVVVVVVMVMVTVVM
ncbi:Zinc Finger Cchc Domain-Containing Protein 2 [Manis pentadactyla]|nr:Zinc Finger Cchc Domain-Containing Protein 2 [Manis pentadactyla]